jgi:hypothetical protein
VNHDQPQSDDASLMLAAYQGPEDHALMSLVFRGLLEELDNIPLDWSIKLSTNNSKSVDHYSRIMVSKSCDECKKLNVPPSEPIWLNKMVINKVTINYGGDMPSLGELLGLSGPSSIYFCNNCLCNKSALDSTAGVLHALQVPIDSRLIPMVPPPLRTLAQMDHDHYAYVINEDKKSEVKYYHNCVRPCLVRTILPIMWYLHHYI